MIYQKHRQPAQAMLMTRLYLPITSQPRELDAKLLLALTACERGLECVLGFKGTFRGEVSVLKPGYFLSHTARQNPDNFEILRLFGNRVLVLDEEALVRQSDEIFRKKHQRGAFRNVAKVLCWGNSDKQMWDRLDEPIGCPTVSVGNPRIDLLRPECRNLFYPRVEELRKRFGDYVLLNTNFPAVNNITPQGEGVRLAAWAMDDRGHKIERAFLANKRSTFEAMQKLICPLAQAIAPLKLIVRPHPNERHDVWQEAAKGTTNVEIVFEGSVVPWLIGAKALIHNNCTTGVEAAVIGTPVLNFRPWVSEDFDNPLVHAFGRDCRDAEQLAAEIGRIVAGEARGLTKASEEKLRHHIVSFDGALASDRIVDMLEAEIVNEPAIGSRGRLAKRLSIHWRNRRLWLGRFAALWLTKEGRAKRAFLRNAYPNFSLWSLDYPSLGGSLAQLALHIRQFPPICLPKWQQRIDDIAAATGRFHGFSARLRRDGLVEITRGQPRDG